MERKSQTDNIADEYDSQIDDLEGQIEEAMEAGDSKKVVQLTRQLSDLTAERKLKQHQLEQSASDDDLDEEENQTDSIIPRAQRWVNEQDWWDDDDYSHVRAYVRRVDLALQKKGYRPTDEDYYEELERIVDKKYPEVLTLTMDEDFESLDELDEEDEEFDIAPKKKRAAKKAKKKTRRARSPVSEGDSGGTARGKNKVRKKKGKTLTRARIANMRMFGMDPENTEHVEAYLEGV